MDNSSRNIVKFIATITIVALLIMAARFYSNSQKVTPPPVTEEVTKPKALPEAEIAEQVPPEADSEEDPEQIIEEDAELIMGEPSVNLETGGTQSYSPPPPTETPAAPPVDQ